MSTVKSAASPPLPSTKNTGIRNREFPAEMSFVDASSFFLRVGDRVKKVSFSGELTDLVLLFKTKFPDELSMSFSPAIFLTTTGRQIRRKNFGPLDCGR
jgi:hypothetical protein